MLKVVGQSVPLLCVLLATYILIIFGGPYFSTPANGPLEYHTSGQCHMLATVEVDSLASYFSIFDVLLAAFLLVFIVFNLHFDPRHCFGFCWCEVSHFWRGCLAPAQSSHHRHVSAGQGVGFNWCQRHSCHRST